MQKMASARPRWNEADRLTALHGYRILDTAPEPAFDGLVKLAAHVCQAPVALVSLVEADRQWFKAGVGLGVRETPIEQSFCAHAIRQPDLFVVPDAREDPRFAENPLVTGEPYIRFYAGAVLETPGGLPLGTLCIIDPQARPEGLSDDQGRMLLVLARQVMSQLQHRAIGQRAETERSLLLAELQHRVRNTLAMVGSLVRRSARTAESLESYAAHLEGRIAALSRVESMVTHDPFGGVDLEYLVAEELRLAGAREGEQATIAGPGVRLTPKAAETVALAVHELATNAVKYGALTSPGGRISVTWTVMGDGEGERLAWEWVESGVALNDPALHRTGFGTEVLERTLGHALQARTALAFGPEGVSCAITFPLTSHTVVGTA